MRALAITALAACSAPAQQPTAPPVDHMPRASTPDAAIAAPPDASAPADAVTATARFEVPPRSTFGDLPTTDATGSFASPPRKDWPCAYRERYEDDTDWRVKERFVNAKRASCRLPLAMADDGIFGCVERGVVFHRNKFWDLRLLTYGHKGNLVLHDSNFGSQQWTWESEVPTPDDAIPVIRTPGRLEASLIGKSIVDVDAKGRPLRSWTLDKHGQLESRCEFSYQGERFIERRCFDGTGKPTWRYDVLYDCKALGTIGPSSNKGGKLGIPM